jgi:hypothetical protein
MRLEDLQYIFNDQIQEGTTLLYFMVSDSPNHSQIVRHSVDDLCNLVPFLDCYQYTGTDCRIPRFVK